MVGHYLRRGYPKKILKKHVDEVKKLKQCDLLEPKEKQDSMDRIVLTLEYNPANPDILGIINSEWHQLESSPKLSKLFKNKPLLAHKRAPNLRDTLVRATTQYPPVPDSRVKFNPNAEKCKRRNCPYCPKPSVQGYIKSKITKETYRTTKYVSCESRNVIYCIECTQCGKQYIGETKRSFRIRISEHMGDVRNTRNYKPVARHFNSRNHTIKNMKNTVLETITQDPELEQSTIHRRTREAYWIHRLRTIDPMGINSMG
jgi:hypothetical protein